MTDSKKYIVAKNVYNEEKEITLIFDLCGKTQKMSRKKDQLLGSTLFRILLSKKRISQNSTNSKIVLVDDNGSPIDEKMTNLQGFKAGIKLVVDEDEYDVYRDPITIGGFKISRYPCVGFPVDYTMVLKEADPSLTHFHWYRFTDPSNLELVSTSSTYTPTDKDVGYYVKVTCQPRAEGQPLLEENCVEAASKDKILPYMGPFLYESRFIPRRCGNVIRAISYNILAEHYTTTETAAYVMYPDCAPFAIHMDYRRRLLEQELRYYDADLVALQECEERLFSTSLLPYMRNLGYDGRLFTKNITVMEGEAFFFKSDRFSLLATHDVELSWCLQTHPSQENLRELLSSCSDTSLWDSLVSLKSVAQVLYLYDSDNDKRILAFNTHLYYAPDADNVRALQTYVLLSYASWIRQKSLVEDNLSQPPSIILFGDWNSTPESPAIELLLTRQIKHTKDVFSGTQIAGKITSDLSLFNATGFPKFTTWVSCFQGLLDYIFVDTSCFSRDVVAYNIPREEEILKYRALPSPHAPSDHLPVICDLKYRNTTFSVKT